jgi:hypothetical protein
MFILRDLLLPLQSAFSDCHLGRQRAHWFIFTLLAVIVPFTSSISSNLLRSLETLFGITPGARRFYTFMASSKLPWERLWTILWSLIPDPTVDGRLLVALDDSINNKSGRHIFGCGFFHDHTAKLNQPSYPWSQNIVSIGLLKIVKGRWACLPLAFRFYLMSKDIQAGGPTVSDKKTARPFASKLEQAVEMLVKFSNALPGLKVLVVTDSWFGNNGLFAPLRSQGNHFELLSRLRSNITLYDLPAPQGDDKRGRPRKYGDRLGAASAPGASYRSQARSATLRLYGRNREVWFYDRIMMLKTLKCPVRVVWVYRQTRFIALFSTDLSLTPAQIIEYYGARWKIESGFKEIKQEIGSARAQVRTADSVTNHLQFCMMATTFTWLYADRIVPNPQRRHVVKGRTSFAFSDVRRLIAEAALDKDFMQLWPNQPKPAGNRIAALLLRLVA